MEGLHKYEYDGPVVEFDRLLTNNWHGETMAVSIGKARSNLAYRFRKETNRGSATKISLPGKIKMIS